MVNKVRISSHEDLLTTLLESVLSIWPDNKGGLLKITKSIYEDLQETMDGTNATSLSPKGKLEKLTSLFEFGRAHLEENLLEELFEVLEEAEKDIRTLAEDLLGTIDSNNASDLYNQVNQTNPQREELILNAFATSSGLQKFFQKMIELHTAFHPEVALPDIEEDVKNRLALTGRDRHFSFYDRATYMGGVWLRALDRHLGEGILRRVKEENLPLAVGQKPLEGAHLAAFEAGMSLGPLFLHLNGSVRNDMAGNTLGKKLSHNFEEGTNLLQQQEREFGIETPTFAFVYLSEEQKKALEPLGSTLCLPLKEEGQTYYAIPWGAYVALAYPEHWLILEEKCLAFREAYLGTPIADYIEAFLTYLKYGQSGGEAKGFSEACYAAEEAWMHYMAYAETVDLPFILIHPFEHDSSCKIFDLALAPREVLEGKESTNEALSTFTENFLAFCERKAWTQKYPRMVSASLDRLKKLRLMHLTTRFSSVNTEILGQLLPNYHDKRSAKMKLIFADREVAINSWRKRSLKELERKDPLGTFVEGINHSLRENPQVFEILYNFWIVRHEMTHLTLIDEKKKPIFGDGTGIALAEAEEVRASYGIIFNFRDPENLTEADCAQLRTLLPLLINQELIERLSPQNMLYFEVNLHLRIGVMLLEHALKTGLLEVLYVKVGEGGNLTILEGVDRNQSDFETLHLNLDDETIRSFVKCMTQLIERFSEPHWKMWFEEGSPEKLELPDLPCPSWLLLREIAKERENQIEDQSKDSPHKADVRAVISFAASEQPQRLQKALAQVNHLDLSDPQVPSLVDQLKSHFPSPKDPTKIAYAA